MQQIFFICSLADANNAMAPLFVHLVSKCGVEKCSRDAFIKLNRSIYVVAHIFYRPFFSFAQLNGSVFSAHKMNCKQSHSDKSHKHKSCAISVFINICEWFLILILIIAQQLRYFHPFNEWPAIFLTSRPISQQTIRLLVV